jgi:hypothetical protein
MKMISLRDCKLCDHNKNITGKDNIVRCGRINDSITIIPVMPSNYNTGFKNGEMVVHCMKD